MKESKFHMVDLSQAITMPLIKQSCINTIQTQLSSESDSNDNGTNINIGTEENNSNSQDMLPSNLSENEIRQIVEQLAFVHPSAFHPKPRLTCMNSALFKSQLEYLGHLITTEGIKPLQDKVDTILRLQPSTTVTEVKHIIANYYKKFLPLLSEVIRPPHHLMRKNVPFEWTIDCQNSLDCLKHTVVSAPVLIYPELSKPYILYTDSNKHTWAGILTQTCTFTNTVTQQVQTIDLPVTFQSGSYPLSQEKWSTIQKEAYAIYASFKKMVFYLRDAHVLIRSDHAPLRKFIYSNTINDQLMA